MDRFIIAPFQDNSGVQTNFKPWIIPDSAFAQLNNAYVWRGRVRKRFGSLPLNQTVSAANQQQATRLRINIGTTDGAGNIAGIVPGAIFKIGQLFSIGSNYFTVYQTGAPAAMLRSDGSGATATYNTVTGAFVINGSTALTVVYFYPAEPVMGLLVHDQGLIINDPTYAFDTQFAYSYSGSGWERLGTAVWTGTDADFFWGASWRGTLAGGTPLFFVTNFVEADNIKYYNSGTGVWTVLNPTVDAVGTTLQTARIIVPFKGRLVVLNTIERVGGVSTNYFARARWCQVGSPIAVDAWRRDLTTANFLDCPVDQPIITARFIKDHLIVYCTNSTWELAYTGNQVLPFQWNQINQELGAESTFSAVPFDKVVLAIGNVGIHACTGGNVERIDDLIPDTVWEIHDENESVDRVCGIRDYFTELVYWSMPDTEFAPKFPNKVLVYNYKTGSWAFNDDSITTFGYFNTQANFTWGNTTRIWGETDTTWGSATQKASFNQIIAGNQEGFTFIIDSGMSRNMNALQVTNITNSSAFIVTLYVRDHNLRSGDYIYLSNVVGPTELNNTIYQVYQVVDDNQFTIIIAATVLSTPYLGGGTLARVSQIDILTKQYNFYVEKDRNAYVARVDFGVDKTDSGAITVDCFTSSSTMSLVNEGSFTGSLVGTNVLETTPYATVPYESTQDRLWHPIYFQADGQCIQLRLYLNDSQMRDTDIAFCDFQLNGMIFYATPTAQRLQ